MNIHSCKHKVRVIFRILKIAEYSQNIFENISKLFLKSLPLAARLFRVNIKTVGKTDRHQDTKSPKCQSLPDRN
jgi:hypothetical protein